MFVLAFVIPRNRSRTDQVFPRLSAHDAQILVRLEHALREPRKNAVSNRVARNESQRRETSPELEPNVDAC